MSQGESEPGGVGERARERVSHGEEASEPGRE